VDALNAAGAARAQELAHVLEKSGISAIYTSEAVRTQQTAAPIASLLGVTPVAVAGSDVAGLVRSLRSHHPRDKVLVVGHSNTVPQVIAELGGPTVTIGDDEYDNLYVLAPCRCRWESIGFTNLRYGAASPRGTTRAARGPSGAFGECRAERSPALGHREQICSRFALVAPPPAGLEILSRGSSIEPYLCIRLESFSDGSAARLVLSVFGFC
jgi:hypothetical protein